MALPGLWEGSRASARYMQTAHSWDKACLSKPQCLILLSTKVLGWAARYEVLSVVDIENTRHFISPLEVHWYWFNHPLKRNKTCVSRKHWRSDCQYWGSLGNMNSQIASPSDNHTLCYNRPSTASQSREGVVLLWSVLVQPHLEHWVQFWVPQYKKDKKTQLLGIIQRRPTKIILWFQNPATSPSLHHRRDHAWWRHNCYFGNIMAFYLYSVVQGPTTPGIILHMDSVKRCAKIMHLNHPTERKDKNNG